MARAKYQIGENEAHAAYRYLSKHVEDWRFWPDDYPWEQRSAAVKELEPCRTNDEQGRSVWHCDRLQAWVDRWLDAAQLRRLRTALRQQRYRQGEGRSLRSVDLTWEAHHLLYMVSQVDGITLSEVIERYLKPVADEKFDAYYALMDARRPPAETE